MLTLLIVLTSAAVVFGLGVVLPILSWARANRLQREVELLRARLAALEASLAGRAPSASPRPEAPPEIAALPAAPPEPVAPEPAPPMDLSPQTAAAGAPPPAVEWPAPPDSDAAASHRAADRLQLPDSLEEVIGARLMLWVGAIVLVLGVAFFLKYAFDNEWITESMRVALGIAAGLALVAAGDRFASRGYAAYGQIVAGGGIAVLFLAIYAAYSFYALIGQALAFVLMIAVTAGAASLADRQRARGLALMAVGGGFVTPFLVGSGRDAQLTLFTYDALLVVGTLYLANRQNWPVLNVLSFVFTTFTIVSWAAVFYTPAKWVRTELFLTLFCVLFVLILRAGLRRDGWRSPSALVLAAAPLLYHAASLAILGPHGVALWVYLIAVSMVGIGLAVRLESGALRMTVWGLVVPALVVWVQEHPTSRSLVPNLVTAAGIFALHALAQLDLVYRHGRRLGPADLTLLHANGYALVASTYLALEHVWLAIAPAAVALVGLVHGGLAAQLRVPDGRAALHALAVAIGAATVALAIELDGPWLTVALAVEGALVALLGLLSRQPAFRLGGTVLLAAAVARYVLLSITRPPAVFSFFNEAFTVGLVLAGILYFVAWRYRQSGEAPSSETTLAVVAASVLVVIACSAQNEIYWTLRGDFSADARFAASLSLSAIWTLLAAAFIGAGLWRNFAPLRYLAMALFGLTVLKVFLVDLSSLGGIYRVLGFIGVGLMLLAVSFLYQRTRRRTDQSSSGGNTEGTETTESTEGIEFRS